MDSSSPISSAHPFPSYSTPPIPNSLRFDNVEVDDIESLIHCPASTNSSFTALLGLPPNQALHLLHHPPNKISENFDYTQEPKSEPPDSFNQANYPLAGEKPQRTAKRKESDNNGKVKAVAAKKKKKRSAEESTGGEEKLPYVHVRARRGEATDSHSLAERARREKINARMKLLQEIVPGCSKISGTALVLDQIINHVQCLQRQVEFLSMRLATVNPRIDFGSIDGFLSAEYGRVTTSTLPGWSFNGHPHHQVWHVDSMRQYEQSSAISSLSFIPTAASSSTPVPCSSPTASSLTAARL